MLRSFRTNPNEKENGQLTRLRDTVYKKVRMKYRADTPKNEMLVRVYGNFGNLDIDPTKTRPSGEALFRRVLNGKELPKISVVVDVHNLASSGTMVSISGLDADLLTSLFYVRFARNEAFTGIGTDEMKLLTEKMLALSDEKQILCLSISGFGPHQDLSVDTNAVTVGYGGPWNGTRQFENSRGENIDIHKEPF